MFLNLYSDKTKGIIMEQRFVKWTEGLEAEQNENDVRMQELMKLLHDADKNENDIQTFICGIREYGIIKEQDETVLNRLIDKILIGEVKKIDEERLQEVKIFYNFVGEIMIKVESRIHYLHGKESCGWCDF